jgi:hypothetical protein
MAADVDEDALDRLEQDLVTYDTRGQLFGTSGAGAHFLATYLLAAGWRPPAVLAAPPAVTEGEREREIEAAVLDEARTTINGAMRTENGARHAGMRFAAGVLQAMAYERREHDWIESVRSATPSPAVTAAEDETHDETNCPKRIHSERCADAPVVAAVPAEDGQRDFLLDDEIAGLRAAALADRAPWAAAVPADPAATYTHRPLTVMEAHEAKDCPDRDGCWAADIHDKHSPRVPADPNSED